MYESTQTTELSNKKSVSLGATEAIPMSYLSNTRTLSDEKEVKISQIVVDLSAGYITQWRQLDSKVFIGSGLKNDII